MAEAAQVNEWESVADAWEANRQRVIVPMGTVETVFSVQDQRAHRMVGVDECLRVRLAGD